MGWGRGKGTTKGEITRTCALPSKFGVDLRLRLRQYRANGVVLIFHALIDVGVWVGTVVEAMAFVWLI